MTMTTASLNGRAHTGGVTNDENEVDPAARPTRRSFTAEYKQQILDEYDPFLIGSVLSGKIRKTSDIDLHAYSDNSMAVQSTLEVHGYDSVEEEVVNNQKGRFIHLKWKEMDYPVEITVYPWSWREKTLISSVTGKAMKRCDERGLLKLMQ